MKRILLIALVFCSFGAMAQTQTVILPVATQTDTTSISNRINALKAGYLSWLIETPTASESLEMVQIPFAITVTSVKALVQGTSPSVTYNIAFGTDVTSLTNVYTSGQTVTSVTTGASATGFNDATIPANSWIVITTSAVSGTVTSLTLTLNYTKD